MKGGKGGSRASRVPLVIHTCYKVVEGSKEKYSVNDRSSHPDVFYKKVLLKVLRFPQKNICLESLLNKVIALQQAIL